MKAALQKSMEMEIVSTCRKEAAEEEQRKRRKGRRKKVDLFAFLPDDIVVDIFKRLPEAFLSYRAKYVCRRWLDVIISNGILPDCASFILQIKGISRARHVGIREEEGEKEGLKAKVKEYLDMPLIGKIRSRCNEFLLISDDKREKTSLYVYNLITKEGSYLPECKASCGGNCTHKCGVALFFDSSKRIYKVLHLYPGPRIECHILILKRNGVFSKWKKIQVLECMNVGWFIIQKPLSVQGRYIHWRVHNDNQRLISMDMVKQELVSLPLPCGFILLDFTIFEMGGSLALFARVSEHRAEIWILKDFQMNKWEKLKSISLKNFYKEKYPVFGVISKSNKYIILKCRYDKGMWYYDMKTGVMKELRICIFDKGCMVHSSPPSF